MPNKTTTFFVPSFNSPLIVSDIQLRSTFFFYTPPKIGLSTKKLCYISLRARALTRRYWLARTAIRSLTKFGYLSGHRKSSW